MNGPFAQPKVPQNPDYRAVSTIFDEYAPLVHKYVGRFCQDPEEEDSITGDVFVQYPEKLSLRKRPPSDPRISLSRIAYGAIVKCLQASEQKPPAFITSLPSREEEQVTKNAFLSALNQEIT